MKHTEIVPPADLASKEPVRILKCIYNDFIVNVFFKPIVETSSWKIWKEDLL